VAVFGASGAKAKIFCLMFRRTLAPDPRSVDTARGHRDLTERRLESGPDENQTFDAIFYSRVSKMQHSLFDQSSTGPRARTQSARHDQKCLTIKVLMWRSEPFCYAAHIFPSGCFRRTQAARCRPEYIEDHDVADAGTSAPCAS
jgi:hypothetical protein